MIKADLRSVKARYLRLMGWLAGALVSIPLLGILALSLLAWSEPRLEGRYVTSWIQLWTGPFMTGASS